jgi:uncharacterized Zn-finger protein
MKALLKVKKNDDTDLLFNNNPSKARKVMSNLNRAVKDGMQFTTDTKYATLSNGESDSDGGNATENEEIDENQIDQTSYDGHSCSVCNKKFANLGNLNRHTQSAHSSIKHTCANCEKTFTRSDSLRAHSRICKKTRD